MSSFYHQAKLRVPVRFVDGHWEFMYGGGVPIRNGTIGDLVIDTDAITDLGFLSLLRHRTECKILAEGTELLVALTIKPTVELPGELKQYLIPKDAENLLLGQDFYTTIRSPDTQFVKVTLGAPTDKQMKLFPEETGGAWLQVQGTQPKGIFTSKIAAPMLGDEGTADSLNYAFTQLSKLYEPWRKANTGNIYDRVLYRERNGQWYPIRVLRDAQIARDEHALIRELWDMVSRQLPLLQGRA